MLRWIIRTQTTSRSWPWRMLWRLRGLLQSRPAHCRLPDRWYLNYSDFKPQNYGGFTWLSPLSYSLLQLPIVSPLFFACASADVTKQYFKNFITAFLQCGLQIVFMVIIYGVGIRVLNNNEINGSGFMSYGVSTMNTYRSILVYIIMGILIVKPPKFLTNAIN